ncbi:MAG: Alkaline phosphatase synthesis transcriptional regulatory protein PhoP, two-component system, OmpR [Candidatus Nomurabacteria bacterium]|nr:Alkaline phosphatase synthesis transcriptional regulatory protein PhoP, two-component system, OmpR [Candidatus Nomurabacteria bacterium]
MKKILTIEDDQFLKKIEATKFSKSGFEVETAMTKADIDTCLAKSIPDIILLDIMLPDIDGYSVLKNLKADEKTKAVPVIVFSNLSSDQDIKKMTEAGAAAFMIKSNFTLDEVVEKIHSLIGA